MRVELDGALPFDDGAFDLVWSSEVIEHVSDTARWLSEMRRVLVPRGRAAAHHPSHGRLRVALGGDRALLAAARAITCTSTRDGRSLDTLTDFGFGELSVRAAAGSAAAAPAAAGAGGALTGRRTRLVAGACHRRTRALAGAAKT